MKKIFTFFLVLAASMGIVYASNTQVDGIWYDFDINNHTASVTYRDSDYHYYDNEYSGEVIIPENVTYNGITYSVTSIGYHAFRSCSTLTSITIPNSVTSIGYCAFYYCSSLASVTIPNSVTTVRGAMFYGCSKLKSVVLSNNITSLPSCCDEYGSTSGFFENCSSLTSVTIPNSVTSIGDYAFYDCSSLTSITIPNSVTSIGNHAFEGCSSLTSPVYNAHCFAYLPTSYSGHYTIPEGIKQIAGSAFAGCESLTSVTIPNSVTSIGNYAFEDCSSLTSVTIGNSVESIGYCAFLGCSSLTSITIPNSVTRIGYRAFCGCSSLEYLSIPNSVQYSYQYPEEVHYYDGYESIFICPNLKTLIVPADFFGVDGDEEDYQTVKSYVLPYLPERLESLTINDGTTHRLAWDFINRNYKTLKTIDLATTTDIAIAEEAFKNCYKLENLALPSQLEYIPYMAIAECVKLQSITIPATVTEIEDRAFENCRSIKSIIFEGAAPAQGPAHHAAASGSSLWRIGSWAFYNCHQLQNLTIPEGVTEVGDAAFYGCTYLEDMVLPSTIQEIGDNGFALCAKLKKIHVKAATPPTIQAKTFFDVNRQIPVYVPDEVVEAYKSNPYWSEFDIQGESKAPSAVEDIHSPSFSTNTQKFLRNGQLIILRDGVEYNAMGQEM